MVWRAILTKGGVLRPYTAVDSIAQSGSDVAVKTRSGHTILGRDVVCATNAPIAGRLTLQAKMAPYQSGEQMHTRTWITYCTIVLTDL
jgi:hypothetical protein